MAQPLSGPTSRFSATHAGREHLRGGGAVIELFEQKFGADDDDLTSEAEANTLAAARLTPHATPTTMLQVSPATELSIAEEHAELRSHFAFLIVAVGILCLSCGGLSSEASGAGGAETEQPPATGGVSGEPVVCARGGESYEPGATFTEFNCTYSTFICEENGRLSVVEDTEFSCGSGDQQRVALESNVDGCEICRCCGEGFDCWEPSCESTCVGGTPFGETQIFVEGACEFSCTCETFGRLYCESSGNCSGYCLYFGEFLSVGEEFYEDGFEDGCSTKCSCDADGVVRCGRDGTCNDGGSCSSFEYPVETGHTADGLEVQLVDSDPVLHLAREPAEKRFNEFSSPSSKTCVCQPDGRYRCIDLVVE